MKRKTWQQMTKGERITGIVGLCIAVMVGVGLIGGFVSALTGPHDTPPQSESQPVTTYKDVQETEAIPFDKETHNDSTRDVGESVVTTPGVNGVRTKTFHVTYVDGKETNRVQIKDEITLQPVTEITSIGIHEPPAPAQSNCNPNYSGCVPNVSYDLDCADIGHSVMVTGYDEYGLDRDKDGYGCESY